MAILDVTAGYTRPDLAELERQAEALGERLRVAGSAPAALATLAEWNALRSRTATDQVRAFIGYARNTSDTPARQEQEIWDEAESRLRRLDAQHASAVLDGKWSQAIGGELGEQFLALKRCTRMTASPALGNTPTEESQLVAKYLAVTSQAEIELFGERLTFSQLRRYLVSSERDVRFAACRALDRYLADKAPELGSLMTQLIAVRQRMGRAVGYDSYVPLAYLRRERIGYGPQEAVRFRETIAEFIVPLCAKLRARQAARLGLDKLSFYDEWVLDSAFNPVPVRDTAFVLDTGADVARRLHPACGELFELMLERGTLDVEARSGKLGGASCIYLPDLQLPYVFANFNGSKRDVDSLFHEFGHAFQMHCARGLPLIEQLCATSEGAELCAMGMQVLCEPALGQFFEAPVEVLRRTQLEESLLGIPLLLLMDHFQHEIYERPALTAAERNALWLKLERRYMPWRDYGQGVLPSLQSGAYWLSIQHFFTVPFYALDYVLARFGELQIRERVERDRAGALEGYLAMCRLGGSVRFSELLAAGGLRSPFEREGIAAVFAFASRATGG